MIKFLALLLLLPALAQANPPITWGGSTTAQLFPTIVKELLGNGYALIPAKNFVGDCSDGDLTISSGTTTLLRDMYYNNVTISGTAVISAQNQRIFVCGTLDLSNAPVNAINGNGGNGGNASGATGGSAGAATAAGTNVGARTGGAGATATTAAGTSGGVALGGNAVAGTTTSGSGGGSGAGGTGTGAGGAARARVTVTAFPMRDITTWFLPQTGSAAAVFSAGSGPGGGSGAGDGTNTGAGGGGGGASGATVYLSANIIKTGVSTPSGVISVNGGNGGNGAQPAAGNTGGGGAGGGGAGGWSVVKWNSRTGATVTNGLSATGGANGTAGAGRGTGTAGTVSATTAMPGLIQTLDLSIGLITSSITGSMNL